MIDRAALARAIAREGRVVRVVVAETRGSAPREAGAAMLVLRDSLEGTIGGGTLEHEAMATARTLDADRLVRRALGPDLGQCCGGAVALLFEVWDTARLESLEGEIHARPLPGHPTDMPFAVKRLLAAARGGAAPVSAGINGGWMVEPLARDARPLWIWGAGHVGRALVGVMAPLPGLALTWVDTGPERFPEAIPDGVTALPATDPALLARHAPRDAWHLVLTYSHVLDLAICDAVLGRGFGWCGLIGSASKWARFRRRLGEMGHAPATIAGITCPIGTRAFGKHPQEIAVGVAADILARAARQDAMGERTG